jgi:hypothetical protein
MRAPFARADHPLKSAPERLRRIKVAIVQLFGRRREESVSYARQFLAGNREPWDNGPEPVVIADIPLSELMKLECEAEHFLNLWTYTARRKRLFDQSGFQTERREFGPDVPTTIYNDFVAFSYRRVDRPTWLRFC